MKITIDKKFTTLEQVAKVKEDIKMFKEMYSERDLLSAFANQAGRNEWFGDILRAEAKAFPGGWAYKDETQFCITMVTEGYNKFYKIRFYIDMAMNVNTNDLYRSPGTKMYSVETYKLQ